MISTAHITASTATHDERPAAAARRIDGCSAAAGPVGDSSLMTVPRFALVAVAADRRALAADRRLLDGGDHGVGGGRRDVDGRERCR